MNYCRKATDLRLTFAGNAVSALPRSLLLSSCPCTVSLQQKPSAWKLWFAWSQTSRNFSLFHPMQVDVKKTALALSITDSELSDEEASILESGGFSVSRATTPQLTDVSEGIWDILLPPFPWVSCPTTTIPLNGRTGREPSYLQGDFPEPMSFSGALQVQSVSWGSWSSLGSEHIDRKKRERCR